nr:MAG TPA: hypothetical protein [Caudoviricetes sp.]
MTGKRNWYEGVPAPVDKNGNVIPLDTGKLVDDCGDKHEIDFIGYGLRDSSWFVHFADDRTYVSLDNYTLAPDDSLERLADDLGRFEESRRLCDYFGGMASEACDGCPAKHRGTASSCAFFVIHDIARRVGALREEERDAD